MNKMIFELPTLDELLSRLESIESKLQEIHKKKAPHSSGLLNTKQAANALQVTTRTLQSLRDRGEIGYVQYGRVVRYKPEDIQAYIDEYYVKSNYGGTK